MSIVREAVKRSAELLDEHFKAPIWMNEIDLPELCMSSEYDCILGQLFGTYSEGCLKLGISSAVSDTYAFTSGLTFNHADANQAWVELIKSRLGDVQEDAHKPLYIVKRYIPDPTNPRSEIEIIVMATFSEEKSGGAIMALNNAGIKCRRSETVLV